MNPEMEYDLKTKKWWLPHSSYVLEPEEIDVTSLGDASLRDVLPPTISVLRKKKMTLTPEDTDCIYI